MDTNGNAMAPRNSDFQEHSKNLLESAVGEAQENVSEQRSIQKMVDPEARNRTSQYREHSQKLRLSDKETSTKIVHQMFDRYAQQGNSDFREHSQNSWEKQAGAEIVNMEVTVSAEDNKCPTVISDFLEDSQNSLSSGECEMDKGEANVSFGDRDDQCLVMANKFRELSPNSQEVTECSEDTQHKHHTRPVCVGEPSEYLRDSLGGVGNNVSIPSFSWLKNM